jgi:uncharacterized protein DUF4112
MPLSAQEQLPPHSDEAHTLEDPLVRSAELIANLLDTVFRVPGTRFKVGLDPLLGLVPGIGDALANLIGSAILLLAHQLGVPRIVQARMGLNILVNGLIGAIPGIGDLFSFWFKSNVRNARLLRVHSAQDKRPTTAWDWAFILGLIATLVAVLVVGLVATIWLINQIRLAVT